MDNIVINTDHIENTTKWPNCKIEIDENEWLYFNLFKKSNGNQEYSVEIIDQDQMDGATKAKWERYIVNRCKKNGIGLKTGAQ